MKEDIMGTIHLYWASQVFFSQVWEVAFIDGVILMDVAEDTLFIRFPGVGNELVRVYFDDIEKLVAFVKRQTVNR